MATCRMVVDILTVAVRHGSLVGEEKIADHSSKVACQVDCSWKVELCHRKHVSLYIFVDVHHCRVVLIRHGSRVQSQVSM